jgi:hypothetical protein
LEALIDRRAVGAVRSRRDRSMRRRMLTATRSRSSNQSIRSKQNKIEEIEKKRLTDSGVIAPWVRAPTVAPRCRGRASACAVFSLGFRFFQAAID